MWSLVQIFVVLISAASCLKNIGVYPVLQTIVNTDGVCRNQSEILARSLKNNTLWAYKMWESSAKDSIGIIEGSVFQLGNFDECVNVEYPIRAQYCLIRVKVTHRKHFNITDPYNFNHDPFENVYERIQFSGDLAQIHRDIAHIGICVPATCSSEDVTNSIQNYLSQNLSEENSYEILNSTDCSTKRIFSWDERKISFSVLVVSLILLVTICTYADVRIAERGMKDNKAIKILRCFSAKENIKDLNKADSNKSLNAMYGFRVMVMSGILVTHSVGMVVLSPVSNYYELEQKTRQMLSMLLTRGEMLVDIFFLFGGLLSTYCYFVQSEKYNVNPFRAIILRYFRLMPVVAIVTYFYVSLFYSLGSGPFWNHFVGEEVHNCQINWWTNLLLINNYVNVGNSCVPHAWYIPCDFHLFIFSIPINIILRRNKKIGLSLMGVLLFISVLVPFLITYIGNKDPFVLALGGFMFDARQNDVFQTVYVPTHTRAAPYITGMFLGYFYYRIRNKEYQISPFYSQILFNGSVLLGLVCVLSAAIFYYPYRPYNVLEGATYAALSRLFYSISAGGILLVMTNGYIPLANTVLRWSILIPFSKLTYGAYMTHLIFQLIRTYNQISTIRFSEYSSLNTIISDWVQAMFSAFILFIFLENPFNKLVKEILPADEKKVREKSNPTEMVYSTRI